MSPPILSLSAALVLALAPALTPPRMGERDRVRLAEAFATIRALHVKPGSSFAILWGGVEGLLAGLWLLAGLCAVGGVFTPAAAPS